MPDNDNHITLDTVGLEYVRECIPADLVARLRDDCDRAVAAEAQVFPPGDDQHGRAVFAPMYGGSFLELLNADAVFDPIERRIGDSAILYTMTTSVLAPGSAGAISDYHVDLDPSLPPGLALSGIVILDEFSTSTGATEFLVRDDTGSGDRSVSIGGQPGDVVLFDPRLRHRSTMNHSEAPRRAVLFQLVRPWMKQRIDVSGFMSDADVSSLTRAGRRRLGLASIPPQSIDEFIARRTARPW